MSARFIGSLAVACALATPAFAQLEPESSGVQAIQERAYEMMQEIDITGGFLPSDPFTKSVSVGGSYVTHFSDFIAWEIARGGYTFNLNTPLRSQLERDFGWPPSTFESPIFFAGTDLVIKPFYGKLSVTNHWVVHTEICFAIGGTFFMYSAPGDLRIGPSLGAFARIFLNNTLSLRIGLDDHIQFSFRSGRPTNALAMTLGFAINLGASE